MNLKSVTTIALLTGAACNVHSGTMASGSNDLSFVASISAGSAWENEGQTQTFFLTDTILKTYAADKHWNILGSGELFAGLQKSINARVTGQIGLAVGVAGNAGLQGYVWDDADPEFANYLYRYKVLHTRITAKGKLIADSSYWLMPWISASAGVAFNKACEFMNAPTIFEAIPNPNFSNHTETSFTYTVGAGLQKALNAHWQAGIGYEFADFGKSSLGRAEGQTLNSGLAMNHLYTHGAMLNLTYIG